MNTFESIQHNSGSFDSHNHTETSETFKDFQQQVREHLSDISARISEYVDPGETSTVYHDFTEHDLAVLDVEDMYQWKAITQLEERIVDVNIPLDPQTNEDIQMITHDFERYRKALLSADQSDPVIKSRLVFSRILANILEAMLQRRLLKQEQQNPISKDDVAALRTVLDAQVKKVVGRFKGSGDKIVSPADDGQSSSGHQIDNSQFIQ